MRFFVYSRSYPQQKIYVNFGRELSSRAEIPYENFSVADLNGVQQFFNKREVFAEVGAEPTGAALIVGALLFIIDPVLGILGGLVSGALANQSEIEKVQRFNES